MYSLYMPISASLLQVLPPLSLFISLHTTPPCPSLVCQVTAVLGPSFPIEARQNSPVREAVSTRRQQNQGKPCNKYFLNKRSGQISEYRLPDKLNKEEIEMVLPHRGKNTRWLYGWILLYGLWKINVNLLNILKNLKWTAYIIKSFEMVIKWVLDTFYHWNCGWFKEHYSRM